MLKRRGEAMTPPIPGLHAQMFRHTAAHRWMAEGASVTDLMRIMGWRSPRCSAATAPPPPTNAPEPRTSA
jgi:integrase